MASPVLVSIFLIFTSFIVAGAVPTQRKDVLESNTLEEDEDIMTRIQKVNEESDVHLLESDILVLEGDPESNDETGFNSETKRNARRSRRFLWKNKKIPFEISPELVSHWYTPTIYKAFEKFKTHTCLQFVPRTNESNWIKFIYSSGCWSSVGQQFWQEGGQSLSLGRGCNRTGTVMHELLHALGFWHEQSRPDRNQYVEVLWENIEEGKENNFAKYDHHTIDIQEKPYDLQSIMHYGKMYFSKNGQPTLLSIVNPDLELGQRIGFSQLDIDEVNQLYDCNGDLSGWSDWSSFAPCDSQCSKKRERFCTSSNPSQDCPEAYYGVQEETAVCSMEECHAPVTGHWGKWSSWSNCSTPCGPGTKTRTRMCDDPPPANGGSTCVGTDIDQASCLAESCGLGPTDCEFEVDENGFCTWAQDTTDDMDWIRNQGTTSSSGTGPSGDHTSGSGHYLYVESSRPAVQGDKARLISQTFSGSTSSVCLILSYNMYGLNMGNLNIYLDNSNGRNLLVSKAGNHGKEWEKLYIDVQSASSFQIIIEGVCGSDYRSDIAIDDVLFISGSCSSYPMRNLGCYADKARPLEKLYENIRKDIDWFHMEKTVEACAKEAKEQGYNVFGVEFYGECWSTEKAKEVYNKDGKSDNCWKGVGKGYAFQAYELL